MARSVLTDNAAYADIGTTSVAVPTSTQRGISRKYTNAYNAGDSSARIQELIAARMRQTLGYDPRDPQYVIKKTTEWIKQNEDGINELSVPEADALIRKRLDYEKRQYAQVVTQYSKGVDEALKAESASQKEAMKEATKGELTQNQIYEMLKGIESASESYADKMLQGQQKIRNSFKYTDPVTKQEVDVGEEVTLVKDNNLRNDTDPNSWSNKQWGGRWMKDPDNPAKIAKDKKGNPIENPQWQPTRPMTTKEKEDLRSKFKSDELKRLYKNTILPMGVDPLNMVAKEKAAQEEALANRKSKATEWSDSTEAELQSKEGQLKRGIYSMKPDVRTDAAGNPVIWNARKQEFVPYVPADMDIGSAQEYIDAGRATDILNMRTSDLTNKLGTSQQTAEQSAALGQTTAVPSAMPVKTEPIIMSDGIVPSILQGADTSSTSQTAAIPTAQSISNASGTEDNPWQYNADAIANGLRGAWNAATSLF